MELPTSLAVVLMRWVGGAVLTGLESVPVRDVMG